MPVYNLLQIKYIRLYAKHFGMDDEQAVRRWIAVGLAERYSVLYRRHYHLFAGELLNK